MKIKQILLCMLLACFILPASAQNSWGIVGGGLFSKSLSRDARFSLGGYAGGMYDVHVKNSWYVQPQLLFTYEEFRSKTRLGTDSFFSKFNLELPILASYNVALNNKWNLRINAGPYLSYAMFGRDKSIDYAYGNGMHSSLGWWHQDFPDHFTYGGRAGVSLESEHFIYTIDGKCSLRKRPFGRINVLEIVLALLLAHCLRKIVSLFPYMVLWLILYMHLIWRKVYMKLKEYILVQQLLV